MPTDAASCCVLVLEQILITPGLAFVNSAGVAFDPTALTTLFPELAGAFDGLLCFARAVANVTNSGLPLTGTNLQKAIRNLNFVGIMNPVQFGANG